MSKRAIVVITVGICLKKYRLTTTHSIFRKNNLGGEGDRENADIRCEGYWEYTTKDWC